MVEHPAVNRSVVGSSPTRGAKLFRASVWAVSFAIARIQRCAPSGWPSLFYPPPACAEVSVGLRNTRLRLEQGKLIFEVIAEKQERVATLIGELRTLLERNNQGD